MPGPEGDHKVRHEHKHNQHDISLHRRTGVVKMYKTVEGYGFFKVKDWNDVYFHIKDMNACGITATPKIGQMYSFCAQRQQWNQNTVKYKASSILEVVHNNNKSRNHNIKNSGDVRNRPKPAQVYPKRIIKNINGEIVVTEEPSKGGENSSAKLHATSGFKIGNPVTVSVRNPTVVSATGPNSAEMAPKPMNDNLAKLEEQICRKKTLYHSLDHGKLPDGGKRLIDEISRLESKLKQVHLTSSKSVTETANCQAPETEIEIQSAIATSNSSSHPSFSFYEPLGNKHQNTETNVNTTGKCLSQQIPVPEKEYGAKYVDFAHIPSGPLFGGRMTNDRISEVRKVTKVAIEELHNSLKSCPDARTEESDPAGLKVDLMTHQRQALTWLLWREQQTVSGGVLADDMGLGKTLTMISLILKQRENEGTDTKTEDVENKIEDFDSSSSSPKVTPNNDQKVIEDEKATGPGDDEETDELEKSESTLIVAPASLVFHWEKEIRNRCDKGLLSIHLYHGSSREKDPSRLAEFDVVITTYDIVRRCSLHISQKRESTLLHINWRRVILDEAHKIKNVKSQSSEAVCKIVAKSRWAMSGTPVQNDITDMYAILKFLNYRPFSEYKLWKNQVDNKTSQGRQRLKTLTSCILLRREKTSLTCDGVPIVSLPARKTFDHMLTLSKIEREVYDKLKLKSQVTYNEFQENVKGNRGTSGDASATGKRKPVTATALLVLLLRMRQCCGHLSLLKGSFDMEILENEKKELSLESMFQSMALTESEAPKIDFGVEVDKSKHFEADAVSAKIDFVINELNRLRIENPHDKSVIISQWTSMLDVFALHLRKSGISYDVISGAQTAKKRMDIVDEFNTHPVKPMVLLLSLQAGGVGLNLIGGNHLYILDMHWNPALESQACDRIYRVGQKKPVFIHRFIVQNTVEENIRNLQAHKLSLAKAVMDGANSKESQKLSLRDMKLLFGL